MNAAIQTARSAAHSTAQVKAQAPSPVQDWSAVPAALVAGEPAAIARTSAVIIGVLRRSRTFDLQPLWEDILQDVLAALIRSAKSGALRDPRAFVGYIATITRHELAHRLTRVGRARTREADTELDTLPEDERRDADTDLRIDLERALLALPEKQRAVVQAVYLEGRSYDEASETLGMPLGTLKRMQTQGLRALRAHMGVDA